jgi:hypothetical protein
MPGSYNQFSLMASLLISRACSSQDKLVYVFWLDVDMTPTKTKFLACTLLLYSTAGSCSPARSVAYSIVTWV